MSNNTVSFAVIGAGMMAKEFASAAARWCHLNGNGLKPQIIAAASRSDASLGWFRDQIPTLEQASTDYHDILANPRVQAVYCAVPHQLHEEMYTDILRSGKHLMGEKPFGIDQPAFDRIHAEATLHPELLVRCASQFIYFPGMMRMIRMAKEKAFGKIISVEAGFLHSSDLNPNKPINWKRQVATCGEYGCMGDLGMHVLMILLRAGWQPRNVYSTLTIILSTRPGADGQPAVCDTWDNALLTCAASDEDGQEFPLLIKACRIAPGHQNTLYLHVEGTQCSAQFSTQNPKMFSYMPYSPDGEQAWRQVELGNQSAYPVISGSIFEFGFSDALMQLWAAFMDELSGNSPAFAAPNLKETAAGHALLTAALKSQKEKMPVSIA